MNADRVIQAWVAQADLFFRETWPWLAAVAVLFAIALWIMWIRK